MTTDTTLKRVGFLLLVGLAVALTLGLLTPSYLSFVDLMGTVIPNDDIVGDYVFAVVWAGVIGISIPFWPVPSRDKGLLIITWGVKMLIALGFMLVFERFYENLDAWRFYEGPKDPNFEWTFFQVGEATPNLQRLIWLHDRVFPESYHGLKVTWSLFSLIGTYIFYRAGVLLSGREERRIYMLVAFTPSIIYWSSILGKDPLSFLGMAMYAFGIIAWWKQSRPSWLFAALLGMILVVYLRPWYAILMILPLVAFVLAEEDRRGHTRSLFSRMLLLGCLGAALLIGLVVSGLAQQFFSPEALIETTNETSEQFVKGGSATTTASIGGMGDLIARLPLGMFTALFRPLPGEIMNIFGIMAALENLVLLFLAGLSLIRFRLSLLKDPIYLWLLIFVVLWAAQYGLTAAGNLGSLSRYRLQILPFLLALLLYGIYAHPHRRKWTTKVSISRAQ